ncbi:MAG: GGDEF domain-containing protein [Anaerolineales bacterium]|nr:MAG: GGDEF domain-containing protein [Anaerolineales bacterium]
MKPFENTDLVRLTYRRVTRFAAVLSIAVSLVHTILLLVLQSPLWLVTFAYGIICTGLLWALDPRRRARVFIPGLLLFWAIYLSALSILTLSLGRVAGFQTLLLGMFPIMVVSSRMAAGAKLGLVIIFAIYAIILQEVAGTTQPTTQLDATAFSLMRGLNLGTAIFAISSIVWQYFRIITEQQAELTALASTDLLTGLHNRRMMTDLGGREVASSLRHGLPLSLLMCDLDHFKTINDEHGHEAGDGVLAEFANLLKTSVRESEAVCRWGGEEFLVLLPNTGLEGAHVLAERIRSAMQDTPFVVASQPLQLTLTIGAASLRPGENFQGLLKRADDALYAGKRAGRNRVALEEALAAS